MGRTPLMPLVTTGILCGPFASFAQFAAQILVAATERCETVNELAEAKRAFGQFVNA